MHISNLSIIFKKLTIIASFKNVTQVINALFINIGKKLIAEIGIIFFLELAKLRIEKFLFINQLVLLRNYWNKTFRLNYFRLKYFCIHK